MAWARAEAAVGSQRGSVRMGARSGLSRRLEARMG